MIVVIQNGVLVVGLFRLMEILVVNESLMQCYDILSGGINQWWSLGCWMIIVDFNYFEVNSCMFDLICCVQYSVFVLVSFDFSVGVGVVLMLLMFIDLFDLNLVYKGLGMMLVCVICLMMWVDVGKFDVVCSFDGILLSLFVGGMFEDCDCIYFWFDCILVSFIGMMFVVVGVNSFLLLGVDDVFCDVDGNFLCNWLQLNLDVLFVRYFDVNMFNMLQILIDLVISFDLCEWIVVGYVMVKFDVLLGSLKFSGNVGVCVVYIDQCVWGYVNFGGGVVVILVDVMYCYIEVLLVLNVKVDFIDMLFLWLGYVWQMVWLQFELLVLGFIIILVSGIGCGGNFNLKFYLLNNFDVLLEWYFNWFGKLLVVVFDKKFDNYLIQEIMQVSIFNLYGYDFYNIMMQVNGGVVWLYGLELGYQQKFDFLFGLLVGFGIEVSYICVFQ